MGPNFSGMRGLIPVLMSNVCYLTVILIFSVVAARHLLVTTGCCSLPDGYCSLLVVTARYRLLLLVLNFSVNAEYVYCNNAFFISNTFFN